MRSLHKAAWFVLACGTAGALLSIATGEPSKVIVGGLVGLGTGFLLVLALRSRP